MSLSSIHEHLIALQWAQLEHDEAYHKDIVVLPLSHRLKHMALHNAKYTAYFFRAIDCNDVAPLHRAVTDAFVIALATANALNQDLGHDLKPRTENANSLSQLGAMLAEEIPRNPHDPMWLVRTFAEHTGRLAKACESLDHIEAIPFRETMKDANLELFKTILAEASGRKLNITELYRSRIREVERRSVFDGQFRLNLGRKN